MENRGPVVLKTQNQAEQSKAGAQSFVPNVPIFFPVDGPRSVERPLLCESYVEFLQRRIHELLFQSMVIRSGYC